MQNSKIITLLTDFGKMSPYVGIIKGVILKINPKALIIDLYHEIYPHDILEGAFLLKSSYNYFPRMSIHLAVVDPGVGTERTPIIVKIDNHFFVTPDNGILSYILKDKKIENIIKIEKFTLPQISRTFHARDIFAPISAYLSKGMNLNKFGKTLKTIKKFDLPSVQKNKRGFIGEIIYIDKFGNLITNFSNEFIKKQKFKEIKFKDKIFKKINSAYAETPIGGPLAIWGSFNYLEIAVNQGNAKEFLNVKRGEKIFLIK